MLEWLELDDDWSFLLPTPTTAYFFGTGDSFQGPIEPPSRKVGCKAWPATTR